MNATKKDINKVIGGIWDSTIKREFLALLKCYIYLYRQCPACNSLFFIIDGIDEILRKYYRREFLTGYEFCRAVAEYYTLKNLREVKKNDKTDS